MFEASETAFSAGGHRMSAYRITSGCRRRFARAGRTAGVALLASYLSACAKPGDPDTSNATAASTPQPAATATRCNQLVATMRTWPDSSTRLESAVWHAAGTLDRPQGAVTLPAHCEVAAVMHERTGVAGQSYAIRFKMRLPDEWNQRFFFQGGGGTDGNIGDALGSMVTSGPTALARGFAVVSQDAGHDNGRNTDPARGGAVAFGFDPQARADYGGASLEPVAEAAKALIGAYYGRGPERSYFVGCSKGGQEGMVFAQRHPEVFDGIVAGSPGFSLPRAAVAEAWDTQAFASLIDGGKKPAGEAFSQLPATFSNEQFARVRGAVLAACDADDGAVDGITADWSACDVTKVHPKLEEQVCTDAPGCLSQAQVNVIERVYSGAKDSTGKALYASWPFDGGIGSDGWRAWKIGPANSNFPGINVAMGGPALAAIFTTPPTTVGGGPPSAFEYALDFDFDRDVPKLYATDATFARSAWDDNSARSADMSGFRARGAKMIVPQGVSDPVFSVNDTVAWFREVDRLNDGHAADFVRVFPVPGMAHCGGGPATDRFNAFDALVAWVEQGTPPDSIPATAAPMSPWPGRTRPLCPYPQVARYAGQGSLEDAASFRCE
jgi:Tannase and feruloyl esterase